MGDGAEYGEEQVAEDESFFGRGRKMAGRGSRAGRGGGRNTAQRRPAPEYAGTVDRPIVQDESPGDESFGVIVHGGGVNGALDRAVSIAGRAEMMSQEVQASVLIARRFPRSEDVARDAILRVCGNAGFAEKAHYSYPRGNTTIKGLSIVAAREMARVWGHIRHGVVIVADDRFSRTIQAYAWDMQSNEYVSAEDTFQKLIQRKVGDVTRDVTPDERDLRELTSRRASLLVRNCILALLPWTLKDEVSATATATMTSKAAVDPDAARRAVVDGFSSVNVPIAELEEYIGHSIAACSPRQLEDLRTIWRSIRENETSWAEYYRPIREKAAVDAATATAFAGAVGREVPRPGSEPEGDRRAFLPVSLRMPTNYSGTEAEHLLDVVAKATRQDDVNAVAVYIGESKHFGAKERIALMRACSARTGELATPMDSSVGEGPVPFGPDESPEKDSEPAMPKEAKDAIAAMRKHPKSAMSLKLAYQTRWLSVIQGRDDLLPWTEQVEGVYLELFKKAGEP